MSSDDDSADNRPRRSRDHKKRRVARACDICRKRKVRCDGEQLPGRKCANCAAANLQCSYVQAMKKYPEGYVEALEHKLDKVDKLLKRLHPDDDFTREIGVPITRENWMNDGVLGDPDGLDHVIPEGRESYDPSDDDQDTAIKLHDLTHSLKGMSLGVHVGAFRGKSSTASMVEAAFALKSNDPSKTNHPFVRIRRPEFWAVLPFERELLERQSSPFEFPEDDLLWHLVDRYFTHLNVITPILHRPSFEKQVREGLHLKDEAFGAVLLSVCANGARLSDDRRVLTDEGQNWYSAGWAWFSQVRMTQKALLSSSRLYDLQVLCLTVIYLQGGSITSRGWNIAGIGLRLAQDIGAHRKKVYGDAPTAEDELFKRAFWSLIWMDRWLSALQGRTCALLDDDRYGSFDLDLPADCDDVYWDHPDPEQRFKQPPGKPSQLAYFVASAKQCQILGSALSTIYASGKARARTGAYGIDWEQRTVADFDARMNEWVESLPEYLRWRSTQQDTVFLMQSAQLHAQFYHLQILVHRPFISSRKEAQLGFRSLAVCINAARSCSRLVASFRERVPAELCPYLQVPTFTAGVMLMLGIWNIQRTGISMDQGKETQAVYNCVALLKDVEKRWQSAGRLWDVLSSLVAAGGAIAEPLSVSAPTLKRARESEMAGYEPSGAPADYASPSGSASSGTHASAGTGTGYSSSPYSDAHSGLDVSGPRQDMRLHAVDMSVPSTSSSDLAWGMLPVRSQELGHVALDDPIWVMSTGNFEPAFGAGEPLPLAHVQWQSDHISALANIDKLPSIARQRSAQYYAEQVRPASSYERTGIATGYEQTSPSYGLSQSTAYDQGGSGTGYYTSSSQPRNPTGGVYENYNYAGTSGTAHAYGQSFSTDRGAPAMQAGYPPMYDSHSAVVPSEWRRMSTGAIGAGPPSVVPSDYAWYDQQRQMPRRLSNQAPLPQQFGDPPLIVPSHTRGIWDSTGH
ncbi:hypothetical protein PENSPDRAFT_693721 [Peniophora sp. CONT]|nr:hypothetical protein PENSPDRAFT_693721 [Peniophora sp. CONT]